MASSSTICCPAGTRPTAAPRYWAIWPARGGSRSKTSERRLTPPIPPGVSAITEEFGAMAAFLCSQFAGYMIGQNVLLDGGAFRSTLG